MSFLHHTTHMYFCQKQPILLIYLCKFNENQYDKYKKVYFFNLSINKTKNIFNMFLTQRFGYFKCQNK